MRKSALRVAAYGTVDELNSALGWALTLVRDARSRTRLARVQHDLFVLGAHLATSPGKEGRKATAVPELPRARVDEMERWMDEAQEELEPLREFVLPGGAPAAAALHLVRTVCRRAEREVVAIADTEGVDEHVMRYLNRLSDLLFVLARLENVREGVPDVAWTKDPGRDGEGDTPGSG